MTQREESKTAYGSTSDLSARKHGHVASSFQPWQCCSAARQKGKDLMCDPQTEIVGTTPRPSRPHHTSKPTSTRTRRERQRSSYGKPCISKTTAQASLSCDMRMSDGGCSGQQRACSIHGLMSMFPYMDCTGCTAPWAGSTSFPYNLLAKKPKQTRFYVAIN